MFEINCFDIQLCVNKNCIYAKLNCLKLLSKWLNLVWKELKCIKTKHPTNELQVRVDLAVMAITKWLNIPQNCILTTGCSLVPYTGCYVTRHVSVKLWRESIVEERESLMFSVNFGKQTSQYIIYCFILINCLFCFILVQHFSLFKFFFIQCSNHCTLNNF